MNNYWVYKLTSPSGKVYIGIASNIIKRFNTYKYNVTSSSTKLESSLCKYGFDNFLKEVVLMGVTKDRACSEEIELISYYNELGISLNISKGGELGNNLTGAYHPLSKPVIQFSKDGQFIKKWDNASIAAKELKTNQTCISRACRLKTFNVLNFLFCFESDYKNGLLPVFINRKGLTLKIPIVRLDMDFNLVDRFESSHEASRVLNVLQSSIAKCLGKNYTYKKHFWVYEDDYKNGVLPERPIHPWEKNSKPVVQFDLEGNFISSFPSIAKAAELTGLDRSNINKSVKGKVLKNRKFIWRYENI